MDDTLFSMRQYSREFKAQMPLLSESPPARVFALSSSSNYGKTVEKQRLQGRDFWCYCVVTERQKQAAFISGKGSGRTCDQLALSAPWESMTRTKTFQ